MNDHTHHWQFACKLDHDLVEQNIDYSSDLKLPRPTVRRDDNYKLLFYCDCGELRTINVNGTYIQNYQSPENPGVRIS